MAELQAQLDAIEASYKADHDKAHLSRAFHLIDADNDGTVTKIELVAAMQFQLGADAEFAASFMIALGDQNDDGVLSEAEFVELMAKAFDS